MNIYDVAARAGVSIATVSRVLNGSTRVSPKTREKVRAAMKEADYTPNIFARGLGLGSIKMIGVLCTDVADLYYAGAVSALEKLLRAEEYDVLLYCTSAGRDEKLRSLARLLEKRVDAIIAIGSGFLDGLSPADLHHATATVPVILINGHTPLEEVYSVLCDEAAATAQCITTLHNCGCRHILYLYDRDTPSGTAKRSGVLQAAATLGLAHSEGLYTLQSPRDMQQAAACLTAHLERYPQTDAILTSEDMLAAGVLQALHAAHRSLPVIGFNNSILAQCTQPTLTSVDNQVQALCEAAVETLTVLLEGGCAPRVITLPARLVYRASFPKPAGTA